MDKKSKILTMIGICITVIIYTSTSINDIDIFINKAGKLPFTEIMVPCEAYFIWTTILISFFFFWYYSSIVDDILEYRNKPDFVEGKYEFLLFEYDYKKFITHQGLFYYFIVFFDYLATRILPLLTLITMSLVGIRMKSDLINSLQIIFILLNAIVYSLSSNKSNGRLYSVSTQYYQRIQNYIARNFYEIIYVIFSIIFIIIYLILWNSGNNFVGQKNILTIKNFSLQKSLSKYTQYKLILSKRDFSGIHIKNSDLSNIRFENINFNNCIFENVKYDEAYFENANLNSCQIIIN